MTLPDVAQRAAIITAARNVNPEIRVVVRARYLREREELEQSGVTAAVYEEAEAAVALARLRPRRHRGPPRRGPREARGDPLPARDRDLSRPPPAEGRRVMVPWSQVRTLSADLGRGAARAGSRMARTRCCGRRLGRPDPRVRPRRGFLADAAEGDWSALIRRSSRRAPKTASARSSTACCEADERISLIREGTTLSASSPAANSSTGRARLRPRPDRAPRDRHPRRRGSSAVASCLLEAATREEAIRELASAIPSGVLPSGIDAEILCERVFAREAEISTDLGNGIALPHARCDGSRSPSWSSADPPKGSPFPTRNAGAVRLFFLLVTPTERPETTSRSSARSPASSARRRNARRSLPRRRRWSFRR